MTQTTPESAAYLAAGIRDVVIARRVLDRWRLPLIARFAAELGKERPAARLAVNIAGFEEAVELGGFATAAGTEIGVRVDVSFGEDRGIAPELAAKLARTVALTPGLRLEGVAGYTNISTLDGMRSARSVAHDVAVTLCETAEDIRRAGIECPVVSVSGTPGALAAARVPGVNEICAGAYALLDAGYATAGICEKTGPAVVVRATVTGVTKSRVETDADHLLVDAFHEWAPGTTAALANGRPLDPGEVRSGQVIDLVPAHICPFVLNGRLFHVLDGTAEVVDRWSPVLLPEIRGQADQCRKS